MLLLEVFKIIFLIAILLFCNTVLGQTYDPETGELIQNPDTTSFDPDTGKPIVEEDPNSEASKIYISFANKIKSTYL